MSPLWTNLKSLLESWQKHNSCRPPGRKGLIFLDPLVKIAKDKEDFTGRLNKYQIMSLSVYLHTSHLLSFKLEGKKGVGSGAANLHFLNSCWNPHRSTQWGVNAKVKCQGQRCIHGCLFAMEPTEHTPMVHVRIYWAHLGKLPKCLECFGSRRNSWSHQSDHILGH